MLPPEIWWLVFEQCVMNKEGDNSDVNHDHVNVNRHHQERNRWKLAHLRLVSHSFNALVLRYLVGKRSGLLQFAAATGDNDRVLMFQADGVNELNTLGQLPLHLAAKAGHLATV
jgi:hypothetical protein